MRRALGVVLASALLAPAAGAATGDLTQLPDPFGCHWFQQTSSVCTATTALDQPQAIAMSADGTSAYVAVAQSEAVVHFQRDPQTGRLTQPSDPTGCVSETGSGPCVDGEQLIFANGVAVSPDGENVYVAGANSGAVAILDRSPATGLLSQRTAGTLGCVSGTGSGGACAVAPGMPQVEELEVSPDGKQVYVVGGNGIVTLNRDLATGDLTYASCINELGSGGCTDGRTLWDARGVAVSPDGGSVYATSAGSSTIYAAGMAAFDRDATTGALTQRPGDAGCFTVNGSAGTGGGGTGACTATRAMTTAFDVAVSPDDRNVYVPGRSLSLVSFDRDPQTRAITQKTGTEGCITASPTTATSSTCLLGHALASLTGVAVSPDGATVYASSQDIGGVVVLDRAATGGALTQRPSPAGCVASAAAFQTQCAAVKQMLTAWDLTVDPLGRHVYVAAQSDRVGVLSREGGQPAPTPTPTPTLPPGTTPTPGASPTPTATPIRLPPTAPPTRIRVVSGNVRNGNLTITSTVNGGGTVTANADGSITISRRAAVARKKRLRIASATKTVAAAGAVELTLKPKGKARKFLRKRGKLKATLTITFTPAGGGEPASTTAKATFRYARKSS